MKKAQFSTVASFLIGVVCSIGPLALHAQAAGNTPFREGEDFVYRIHWGAVTGGYSTLSVQNIDYLEGRPAYHLVSEAHSTGFVDTFYHVEDRNEAWLDTQGPRSLRYEKKIREGKYRVHEVVTLDQTLHQFHEKEYRLDKDTFEEKNGQIPPNVLDVLGSLYYMRSLPLEVGKSYTIDVHSGDKTWPLVVKVKKHERVKVKAGKFDCLLVEPELRDRGIFIAKGKKLEVWLTTDERHMPVKMRAEIFIGHVSAELVKLHTPEAPKADQPLAAAIRVPSFSF